MRKLKTFSREELASFVMENAAVLSEDEVLAVLDNPNVTPHLIGKLAQIPRLTGFYTVRVRIVGHRQTPQAHAVKLVHYLYWFDLLALSIDVQVPAPVRRAIDTQLVAKADKLALGERIASARRCSHALIRHFLFDPHPKVFESLLINKRLREDDVLALANSDRATPEQLRMIAHDQRWSFRRAVRLALVLNPKTPHAAAASQLKHLSKFDLRKIHSNPDATVYVRRCIERLHPNDFSARPELVDYNGGPDA